MSTLTTHSRGGRYTSLPLIRSSPSFSLPLLPLLLSLLVLCLSSLCVPALASSSSPLAGDLYCGTRNCYSILGVEPAASPSSIKKSFYRLSLELHPDKNPSVEAVSQYREVTTAYEVLSDPTSRRDYDQALLHPERLWSNQYKYYQHKYRSQVKQIDARILVSVVLVAVSIAHYYYWVHRHKKLRVMLFQAPQVQQRMRAKVRTRLMEEKLAAGEKKPTVLPHEIEARLPQENLDEYAQLTSWEGRHPTIWDTIPVWLALVPYRLAKLIYWFARYFLLYSVLKREYPEGSEDASYATAQALGMPYGRWIGAVPEEKRSELMQKKLWIKKNLEAFKREAMTAKKKTW